jgi:hypothetical protein
VDDQNLRGASNDDLLGRHAFTLAVWALPDLVSAQQFFLAVTAKALVDVPLPRRRNLDADAVEGFISG